MLENAPVYGAPVEAPPAAHDERQQPDSAQSAAIPAETSTEPVVAVSEAQPLPAPEAASVDPTPALAADPLPAAPPPETPAEAKTNAFALLLRHVDETLSETNIIREEDKARVRAAVENGLLLPAVVQGANMLAAALQKEGAIAKQEPMPAKDVAALMLHNAVAKNIAPAATFELVRMGRESLRDGSAAIAFLAAEGRDTTIGRGTLTLGEQRAREQAEIAGAIAEVHAIFEEFDIGITPLIFACGMCYLKEHQLDTEGLMTFIDEEAATLNFSRKHEHNVARALLGQVSSATIAHAMLYFPELEEQLTQLEKPPARNGWTRLATPK